ncbi:single-stranded DNA-binding protein [Anaerorhabdus sp.]|uniref:Single-stranded DNA-binding protein n=1 Tax=bioreactor metagenome TaxID=1076179 RepID=A0A645ETU2_9ZZZZ|nr:single-stranded DNA-binding protein [Anaerorhabdus sp.]MEA4875701.1 single-stranded DNA-binding protein [Anaerorhabdus sp.]
MINRVVLVGRLTKDVDLRKTSSGLSVATFTVACNRRTSGQNQERQADFINCVAWRQTADFLGQYAKKGALVGVEGRIQTRNYDGTDGKKVYVTEVVCDSCQLLESRSASENRSPSNFDTPSYSGMESSGYEADNSGFEDFNAGPSLDISSDDLPF